MTRRPCRPSSPASRLATPVRSRSTPKAKVSPQAVAAEWAKLFQTKTRDDGTRFVCADVDSFGDHPLRFALLAAQGERLPDDHVYAACESACLALADARDSEDDLDEARLDADPY